MHGDKDAESSHNVMRRFLPLVLELTSIQIIYVQENTILTELSLERWILIHE